LPKKNSDIGLEILLELNGEIFPMDNGYWTKFDIKAVKSSAQIPHGVRYSLTLHNSSNKRVLGYDNAHRVKPTKNNYHAKRTTWDHRHEKDKVESYEFESASQLIEDFWSDVDRIFKEISG